MLKIQEVPAELAVPEEKAEAPAQPTDVVVLQTFFSNLLNIE